MKDGSTDSFERKCTNDLRDVVDLVRGELTNLQRSTLGEQVSDSSILNYNQVFCLALIFGSKLGSTHAVHVTRLDE